MSSVGPRATILPEAISTMAAYPVIKSRRDMLSQEYYYYKNDWRFFQFVWEYDYSVSTLNGQAGTTVYDYYEFANNTYRMSYINGQAAIISQYIDAARTGQFDTIR